MTVDDYILLVYRNLKGELSQAEFSMLNNKTAEDSRWASLRYEIEETWDMSGGQKVLINESNTDKLFDRITKNKDSRRGSENPEISLDKKTEGDIVDEIKPTIRFFTLTRTLTSVAAIAVFVFGAVFLFQNKTTIYEIPGQYTLSDNTIINLRSGSIAVPRFSNSDRMVQLSGEAFFDVKKDASRPFSIVGNHVKVQVLGTSFLVKQSGEEIYVEVIEGKVRTMDTRTMDTEVLTAGMKAHHKSDGSIERLDDYNNLSAWKDEFYQFKDTNLEKVISELSIIFDTEIKVTNPDLLDCDFSGNVAGKSIGDLLSRIAKIHNMELKQEGPKYTLIGGNCN